MLDVDVDAVADDPNAELVALPARVAMLWSNV